METAVAVGMSTSMMVLIGVLLFLYRKLIFRSAELGEVLVTRALDVVDESSATYVNKVYIMNAQTRNEQAKEIAEIDILVSNKDIMDMLNAKREESKAKTKAKERNLSKEKEIERINEIDEQYNRFMNDKVFQSKFDYILYNNYDKKSEEQLLNLIRNLISK